MEVWGRVLQQRQELAQRPRGPVMGEAEREGPVP